MIDLRFDPSARLQRFLGRELIADPNLAVIEFVKNAYDAGTSEVFIDFRVSGPLELHEITVSDDGVGMSVGAFQSNWMRPGYSYKVTGGARPTTRRNEATQRMASRVPSGEKGLDAWRPVVWGKDSTSTRARRHKTPWFHVVFDWRQFEDLN